MTLEDYVINVFGSAVGAFAATCLYFYVWCPNHGCCQMKRIRETIEKR